MRSWACIRPRASRRLRRIRPRPSACTRPARGRACARKTPSSVPYRWWQRAFARVDGPGTSRALGAPPSATPASLRWPRGSPGNSLSASRGAQEELPWPHAPGLAPVEPLRLVAKTECQQRIPHYVLVEIALHPVARNKRVAVARQLGTQFRRRRLHKRHEADLDRRGHGAG